VGKLSQPGVKERLTDKLLKPGGMEESMDSSPVEEKDREAANLWQQMTRASESLFKNYIDNFRGYQHDVRDMALSYLYFFSKIAIDPGEMTGFLGNYFNFLLKQQKLWGHAIAGKAFAPIVEPAPNDKRFAAAEWNRYPFLFYQTIYLLTAGFMRDSIRTSELDEHKKRKLLFYTDQLIDAFSPSNFAFTNPEVLQLAQETEGLSLWQGFQNLLSDISKGQITQTDESAFEVGRNLAITEGSVIYQNELIQLIQYAPRGKKVYEIPLFIIPPWINKYYILDLQPHNSFARYLVDKGFTVFMISWKNPSPHNRDFSFDDYVASGVLKAIEVIRSVTGAEKVNSLGYCIGGTLLGISLAVMHEQKKVPVQSATFLAAMLDFTDAGPLGDVIDPALVNKLERGELQQEGILHGHDMERAFNLIRANDLIWHFVVNNYLKGKKPPAFDVLFWTNDNTNLPAKMYSYYLRNMILENKLSRKNAIKLCGELIDLEKIKIPAFVIAMREDHISPPATVFTTTGLLSGPVQFILGDSGHVMGLANPPTAKKYGYSTGGSLGKGFEEWKKSAKHIDGSWWEPWSDWLAKQSGKKIEVPRQAGNNKYEIIEPAPGSYVKEKC